jgi:hypothetical protein
MIPLLFTLLLLLLVWYAARTAFASGTHPPALVVLVDVICFAFALFLVLRFAGAL